MGDQVTAVPPDRLTAFGRCHYQNTASLRRAMHSIFVAHIPHDPVVPGALAKHVDGPLAMRPYPFSRDSTRMIIRCRHARA
ncbi:hypothetical protein EOS_41130 [Caballeronia mineralivorans PML1(12)]|uniref:Uncharacterized protein n=1 Tax=Caballeronia mineralivorans PML1(12) TaxID=908627 RepID=A0A0J1CJ71_9BURK|nr:hypothetical protein EOS_41130 [Caballeronia mineralivorans PML1(12)]